MHSNSATLKQSQPIIKVTMRSWVIVMSAALFFFYEFIQMNMMDAISQPLLKAFPINADALGDMSSYYFLANVIFLLIAGTLLDRFSTRRIILYSLGVCVLGTGLFAMSTSMLWITVCRFLTGIGGAFCFLSVLRLATRWFPAHKMALATGVIVTFAMSGGLVSQTPFALLVGALGWRYTLSIDALFGLVIWLLIFIIVKDYPKEHESQHDAEQKILEEIGYWKAMRMAFLRPKNWLCGIYTSTMNLPINVLGGLWGIMYLTTTYHFSKVHASWITSMLFAGTIVGSPIMGWLSDRIARRKPLMIVGALFSIVLIALVLWVPHLNFMLLFILFALIGIFSSTQIISYPLVAESSERIITAMSVSVVSFTTIGGIGAIQRLYGYLLQTHADARVHHATTSYLTADFHWAMLVFLLGYFISLCASLLVKETYCVQKES